MDAQSLRLQLSTLPADRLVSADGKVLCNAGELLAVLGGPVEDKPRIVQRRLLDALNIRWGPDVTTPKLGVLPAGVLIGVLDKVITGYYKLAEQPGYIAANPAWSEVYTPPAPSVPVEPPKPSKSTGGYGAFVLPGKYEPRLAQYPIIKVVDDPRSMIDANLRNPEAVCIYRRYYSDDVQAGYLSNGANAAVDRWLLENQSTFLSLPFALHEGLNEMQPTPEFVEFEYRRAKTLADLGIRTCVLNLGVGQTSDDLWRREDVKRLVALVQQTGGAIGLHCYAEGVMSASVGGSYWRQDGSWTGEVFPTSIDPAQCWLALRIMRDRQVLNQLGFNPTLLATELGIDDCSFPGNGVYLPHGIKTRGWRSCISIWQAEGWLSGITPEAFYLRQ